MMGEWLRHMNEDIPLILSRRDLVADKILMFHDRELQIEAQQCGESIYQYHEFKRERSANESTPTQKATTDMAYVYIGPIRPPLCDTEKLSPSRHPV
jgi:hypothetical protein